MIEGYYYLHENKSMIFKRNLDDGTYADIIDSDFCKALWSIDPENREHAWNICVEGLASGADRKRIMELAEKWYCDEEDAQIYADRMGISLTKDGDAWIATREKDKKIKDNSVLIFGHGETVIDAMSNLIKHLGYKPSKLWGHNVKSIVNLKL